MANIYDIAAEQQQPNVMGNIQAGINFGQKQQVYGEQQQAYQQQLAQQQQMQGLAPQVIAGDPNAFAQAAAINPAQAQQYQSAGDNQLKRLSGAITYMDQVQKTGNPQAIEQAYQTQVVPYLKSFGQDPPPTFQQAQPLMEQARAKIASFQASQPNDLATVSAGGAVYDKTHQKLLYQNPGVSKPATMVTIHTPNGDQQAMLNPDGTLSALKIGGQPGAPSQVNTQLTPNPNAQSVAADQATALVSTGMDPGQAAAMAMAQHPGTTLAFDAGSKSFRDVSNGSEMIPPTAGAVQAAAPGTQATMPSNGQPIAAQGSPMPPSGAPVSQGAQVQPQATNAAVAPQGQTGIEAPQGVPSPLALPGGLGMSQPKGASSVIDQRVQQVQDLAKNGVTMTPEQRQQYLTTGKVGESFQGNTDVKPFGDETKTGVDYLGSLSGGNADIVKGLLNGTVQLPTGTALKNGFWQSALASVKHADPTWNQAAYKQFADTRKYMTVGKGGALINSINTGAQHLQKLVDDINALDNPNARPLAAASNYLSSNFGGQAVTNFMGDVTPVASELASIYKNGGTPTDQETQHWREALSPNMSRGQQLNVVRGWIDLLAGKLNATHDQYRASMSPLAEPLNVINPKAEEALQKITQLGNSLSTTGQHATPTIDQTPINAPGQQPQQAAPQAQPRAVNSMGHVVVWDPNRSAWVPE